MEMKKIRAAVVGYGNIGHYVVETLRVSPDFEIAGVISNNKNAYALTRAEENQIPSLCISPKENPPS